MTRLHVLSLLDMRSLLPFGTSCFGVRYLSSWWLPLVQCDCQISLLSMAARYSHFALCTTVSITLHEVFHRQTTRALSASIASPITDGVSAKPRQNSHACVYPSVTV